MLSDNSRIKEQCVTHSMYGAVFVTLWVFQCPIAGPSAVLSPRSKLCSQFFAVESVSETFRHESGVACCYCKNEFYQITVFFDHENIMFGGKLDTQ